MKNKIKNQILHNFNAGIVAGLIGSAILFRNILSKFNGNYLWGNDFDPNLIVWILEWGHHKIFQIGDLNNFWNANQFYPIKGSLAFSDSLISAQLFYTPLRAIGLEMLPSMYGTLMGVTILGCYLTNWCLERIGKFNWYERLVIIYIAHFSMPMTSFLEGHYQLFGFQLAPSFFLCLYLFFLKIEEKYLFLLIAIFIFATGFSTYIAPMVVVLTAILVVFNLKKINYRLLLVNLKKFNIFKILFAITALAVFYWIQLRPYKNLFSTLPKQDWSETYVYSGRLLSFLLHAPSNSLIYRYSFNDYGYWERSFFPGLILLLVSVSFFYIQSKQKLWKNIENTGKQITNISIELFLAILFASCLIMSLGPYLISELSVFGIQKIYLPFLALAKIIPGVENIRAPGRFGMFLGLPLGVFFVFIIRRFFHPKKYYLRILLFIFTLVIFDNILVSKMHPYEIKNEEFYIKSKNFIQEHEPLLVLPLFRSGHIETIKNYMEQLKGSLLHYGWLVSGYGSKSTDELNKLVQLDKDFQSEKVEFSSILSYAESLHINKIVIFKVDKYINLIKELSDKNIIYEDEYGVIYDIKTDKR